MLDQNTTALLSTLLGGALTILGGFIANYYTYSISNKSERRKEIRDILELIYKDAQTVDDAYKETILKLYTVENTNEIEKIIVTNSPLILPKIIGPLNEMKMLTQIYVSPLKSAFVAFVGGIDVVDEKLRKLKNEREKDKALDEINDTLVDCCDQFREKIIEILKKKGYSYF